MTGNELYEFRGLVINNKDVYKRDTKLKKLNNTINLIEQEKEVLSKEREHNLKLANEYADMTFDWEDKGAYWVSEGHKGYVEETVWYYNDVEFYRWGLEKIGSPKRHITNFIIKAREADERLNKLIEGE